MNLDTFISQLNALDKPEGVSVIYNPLEYARKPYEQYIERCVLNETTTNDSPTCPAPGKRNVFLGMNPGPFGMAQTGVPFGEISLVRDWIGICEAVDQPPVVHPKRPIQGFDCHKSEVSGRRLWGYFSSVYPDSTDFFARNTVLNYCPIVYMSETGANITPDKLPKEYRDKLFALCDAYICTLMETIKADWLIGVGGFAQARAKEIKVKLKPEIADKLNLGKVLHPSPASPAANRGWAEAAEKQLKDQGIEL